MENKKRLWNQEGNTYLFVLAAMMVIFAVFLTALKVTQYEVDVSAAENEKQ